ncbi:hypothetical protein [Rhabdochromatium marinum]|uniref:hypothetical protein n=1 Tax=Rhabdochromatium marinum TaxID=48729 RepID=UPI001F5B301F|nr:hypothetical protein [Rhabdochromatium marinum]
MVLLGCGHSGLVNTLDWIRQQLPSRPLHAVIGGMHLLRADPERLKFTADTLAERGIAYLAPNHCTGLEAVCQLRQRFPSQFRESPAGTVHRFTPADTRG